MVTGPVVTEQTSSRVLSKYKTVICIHRITEIELITLISLR